MTIICINVNKIFVSICELYSMNNIHLRYQILAISLYVTEKVYYTFYILIQIQHCESMHAQDV